MPTGYYNKMHLLSTGLIDPTGICAVLNSTKSFQEGGSCAIPGDTAAAYEREAVLQTAFCERIPSWLPRWFQAITGLQPAFSERISNWHPRWFQAITGLQPAFSERIPSYNRAATIVFRADF